MTSRPLDEDSPRNRLICSVGFDALCLALCGLELLREDTSMTELNWGMVLIRSNQRRSSSSSRTVVARLDT